MDILSGLLDMKAVWLILIITFIVVEGAVPGLVSIWFAFGSLAALIATFAGAPTWLQIVWFFVVSLAALALTRPLAKKYLNSKVQATNADMIIGKECVVSEKIDNVMGTGTVNVDGKVWTARMDDQNMIAQAGERVTILRIEGVKVIVKPAR